MHSLLPIVFLMRCDHNRPFYRYGGHIELRIRIEVRKVHGFSSQLTSLHNALTLHR